MKKVLILSCSTGQGHNSCALALRDYFEAQGVTCVVQDGFSFSSPRFARFMSWGHATMYRYFPWFFRWGYRYSKTHPSFFREKGWVFRTLIAGTRKLRQYLLEGQFDTVICTHVFTGIMLTHLLKKHPMPLKTAFVATDYTDYPGLEQCDLQQYFIAHPQYTAAYEGHGIPKDRIAAAGIPVRRQFLTQMPKWEAKQRLGLSINAKHLLVMSGSMGCGPIEKILKQLTKHLPDNIEISVICGSNKKRYRRMKRRYRKDPRVHVIGYTDDIPLYMDAADLYLTKPGGISTTEAGIKQLPMVLVNAVAGCESDNLRHFVDMGGAVTASTPKMLAMECLRKLQAEPARFEMRHALQEHCSANGAERIYIEMTEKYQTLISGEKSCARPQL